MIFTGCTSHGSIQRVNESPYTGQQIREIKALDPERVAGLLAGEGLGYAKAAELNHYPGPAHVLELADELALNEDQRAQSEALFVAMQARTSELGAQLIENERLLDKRFSHAHIDNDVLHALVATSATIEGKIRSEHLSAHLAQRDLLSENQIKAYTKLRGYDNPGAHAGHH